LDLALVDFSSVRSWILAQLPEGMRPPLRSGYRLARDVAASVRTRRGLVRATRVIWLRPEAADLQPFRLLKPGPGEVLVRMAASVISPGTERAFLLGLPNTNALFPTIPGYSAAGVIEAVGSGVAGLNVGDRVAGLLPHASHAVVPATRVIPIPAAADFAHAAFVELGVIALQGVRRAGIRAGDRVVVLGLGLVGQLALQLARWAGAGEIVAAARSARFHAPALSGGADRVVSTAHEDVATLQADVVLEATGSADAIRTALACARDGGRVALLGSPRGVSAGLDFDALVRQRQLTVLGAHVSGVAASESSRGRWTRRDESQLFLDLIAQRRIDLTPLVSQRVAPADANRVYDALISGRSSELGIVFDWSQPAMSQATPASSAPSRSRNDSVRPLRIGLVGCGEISTHNAAGIRASRHCTLAHAMDLDADAARSLGRQFGIPYTTELDALLGNPDVDAVVIAVPHNLHASVAARAAQAGKHVILEKPIATTLTDADAIVDACARAGVALTVLFSFRYQPHVQRARELVQAGGLGDIVGTSIQFVTEKPAGYWGQGYTGRVQTDWRGSWEQCGGGVLIMNVCHTIDYFQYITGLRVAQVYSAFSTMNSPVEVEDIIAVSLRYEGGGIGSIQASTLGRGEQMSSERIWGTHGSLVLAPAPQQVYTLRRVAGLTPGRWQQLGKLPGVNRVAAFMDAFAADVSAGRRPAVTGEDARENLAIVLAAYEAGRTGRAVTLPGSTHGVHVP
jgi:2-desacetyl-2-hydroxyethyl bacteriochlorophyllide A dehydrogenase